MDKSKLEISGKNSPETGLAASYKLISEADMEEEAVSRPKSIAKVKASTEADGADEKMLPIDDKVPEVVVFNNDAKSPQNGDAKLDIAEAKQMFVGLTKEELMKYSNDPFWVRLRWFLFILFWVLWATMLVGAVLIIYAAPKCDPPPPRTWYQQGPLARLDAAQPVLDENIKGVIVSWTGDAYEPLENHPDDLALIKRATKDDGKVIVELEPSVSKVWFQESEQKALDYDNYYIWKAGSVQGADSNPSPPNNWISSSNGSSWKLSSVRKEFYYAPFNTPHLNFRNPAVIKEFSKVIEKFLALNVSGIRLRNAGYLLVNSLYENEDMKGNVNPVLTMNDYGFYQHSKTQDLPELGPLLKQWRTLIKNRTESGTLMVAEELGRVDSYKVNGLLVVDMPLQSHIFSKPVLLVNETAYSLNYTLNIDGLDWPLWEAKTRAVPRDVLDIITFLLPGAPLVNATKKVNTALLKIRSSPSIMRGICGVYSLQNNTILAFIRVTPGSPGILVAVNPTEQASVANFPKEIPALSSLKEVTVRYFSSNYNETAFKDVGAKRSALAVPVTAKSAIILEYVPKRDE